MSRIQVSLDWRFRKNMTTIAGEEKTPFWAWFVEVFTFSDSQLKARAGTDAMEYLRFQAQLSHSNQ